MPSTVLCQLQQLIFFYRFVYVEECQDNPDHVGKWLQMVTFNNNNKKKGSKGLFPKRYLFI